MNISDALHLLNYLFNSGPPPATCQGGPGISASDVSFDATGTTLNPGTVETAIGEVDERLQSIALQGDSLTTRVLALEGPGDPELVEIPAGSFMMGSPTSERGHLPNETLHKVTITKSFFMGATEVTQDQFRAIVGWVPSVFAGCGDCPVEGVSWYDAIDFCNRLTTRQLAEGKIPEGAKFRLPTEAEWEYACRAGTTTRFFFGDSLECNDNDGSFCASADPYLWMGFNNTPTTNRPKPVRQKAPNAWGLYDMSGNVVEWCNDVLGPYPSGEVTDPQGPLSGTVRVVRGGDWTGPVVQARCAERGSGELATRRENRGILGFRVVLETPATP